MRGTGAAKAVTRENSQIFFDASADQMIVFVALLSEDTGLTLSWKWDRRKGQHLAIIDCGSGGGAEDKLHAAILHRMIDLQRAKIVKSNSPVIVRLIAQNIA